MIRFLTEMDYCNEAQDAFRKVFKSENPFGEPFTDGIEMRAILFEYGWAPSEELAKSLSIAISAVGDVGFYYTVTNRSAEEGDNSGELPLHMYVPTSAINEFPSHLYPVAHAIYSPNGFWGLMSSYDSHALVGGNRRFMRTLLDDTEAIERQVLKFIDYWKHNVADFGSDVQWMPILLRHIYGEPRSLELLGQTGFSSLL